jgi:hypothetical protein
MLYRLTCLQCEAVSVDLVAMQEHLMSRHGFTKGDLMDSTRKSFFADGNEISTTPPKTRREAIAFMNEGNGYFKEPIPTIPAYYIWTARGRKTMKAEACDLWGRCLVHRNGQQCEGLGHFKEPGIGYVCAEHTTREVIAHEAA